jgi:hypothetical protein
MAGARAALVLASIAFTAPEAGASIEPRAAVDPAADAALGSTPAGAGQSPGVVGAQDSTECVGGYRIIGRVEGRGKVTAGVMVRC